MNEMNILQHTGAENHSIQPSTVAPEGVVFNIMRFSLHDGPGIRTTVFLKGCPLRCRWCHNPESQSFKPQILYFDERCILCGDCAQACSHGALQVDQQLHHHAELCKNCGACVEACNSGARQYTGSRMKVAEVMTEVLKDQLFFDESGGGVTISGGEPLQQPAFVEALLAACKARRIRTVLDTCGFADPDVVRRVSEHVDRFFYDLKLMDSEKHRQYTGVKNELILQNLKMLAEQGSAITVRVPVIPGVNDDSENFDAMAGYLSELGLREIDLLPYHELGGGKYRRLHLDCGMEGVAPPSSDEMNELAARLKRGGFQVRIGD
jgi:pyruvate formate lyase activating enzyme